MARSSSTPQVEIRKSRTVGPYPQYILLGHRHLEKAPPPIPAEQTTLTTVIPVDLLAVITTTVKDAKGQELVVQVLDDKLIEEIAEIELHYRRK